MEAGSREVKKIVISLTGCASRKANVRPDRGLNFANVHMDGSNDKKEGKTEMMAEAGPEMGPASARCGGKRIYFSCLFGSDIGEGEENEQVFSIADYVLGAAILGVFRWLLVNSVDF